MPDTPTVLVLIHGELLDDLFTPPVRTRLESFARARYCPQDRALTEGELASQVGDVDACITTWFSPRFTGEVVGKASRLKIIAHAAGTVKPYVSDAVFDRGIIVTSAAPVIARYVGEMALALTLAGLRNLIPYERMFKDRRARRDESIAAPRTLLEQRVGLVGFGSTGREFARLLRPFNVELLVYEPHVSASTVETHGGRSASLEDVLTTCRVISLHAAQIAETTHLLNAERLRMIPAGALLVNTARGTLIDTAALVAELATGRFCAALDVFDPEEPLPADHPLRELSNVVLAPHTSGPVRQRYWEMAMGAVEDVRLALEGKTPPGAISEEQLARMA
jgi:phosphoglycerate dehydrogenase-like enzyme